MVRAIAQSVPIYAAGAPAGTLRWHDMCLGKARANKGPRETPIIVSEMCAGYGPPKNTGGIQLSTLAKAKYQRARAYILAHPDESKAQQAANAEVSQSLIASARADLVREGLILPSRKTPEVEDAPKSEAEPEKLPILPTPKKSKSDKQVAELLDDDAMRTLAAMMDEIDDLGDEDVLKRLQKQCLSFAFNPRLHPDTRMSASQMWAKLKDQAKTKDLGPGTPLNFEEATGRLRDLMEACGPEITLAAVNAAFTVKDTPNGQTTTEQDAVASESAPSIGATDHPSDPTEAQDLRPLVVEPQH